MLLGCIADDFTGASDLASTLARAGMRTVQFVGAPQSVPEGCEAGVIALKTRSIDPGAAVSQSLAALDSLQAAGCRQILFKYCSTFDSTPDGNIGPVAEALLAALGAETAIVCPAFPTNGRTVYQGHLFVGDRLLSESGMEHHPLNPMTDPDLVRWLGRQTAGKVGRIALPVVARGPAAIRAALAEAAGRGEKLIVCDAVSDADLVALGHAAAGMALITGGSGIAMGLPDNFRGTGAIRVDAPTLRAPEGPAVALSGSCSAATRRQVARHAEGAPVFVVDAAALARGEDVLAAALSFLEAHRNASLPLMSSTLDPATARRDEQDSTFAMAGAVERFFATLAAALVERGTRRLIVAGGETSSAVVSALGVSALEIGPEIDPGVPVLVSDGARPIALALKSGNFGAEDFFMKALGAMDGMRGVSNLIA